MKMRTVCLIFSGLLLAALAMAHISRTGAAGGAAGAPASFADLPVTPVNLSGEDCFNDAPEASGHLASGQKGEALQMARAGGEGP